MSIVQQRPMTSREWGLLLLLSLLWGGSFFFVGVAVKALPPLTIVAAGSDPAGERPRLDPERLDPYFHRRRRALSDRERKTEPAPTRRRSVRPDRCGDYDGRRSRGRADYPSGSRIRDPRGGGLLCPGEHPRPALPRPRAGADRRRDGPSHRFEPDAAAALPARRS